MRAQIDGLFLFVHATIGDCEIELRTLEIREIDDNMMDESLVSVGVPTFNRPCGVARTLAELQMQTYQNIEVLVSHNGPMSVETRDAVSPFLRDRRFKLQIQPENIGARRNFDYVLANTSGPFFMWAADDDHHDVDFVRTLLERHQRSDGNLATVMCGMRVDIRATGEKKEVALPVFGGPSEVFRNLSTHFSCLTPGLIYGLHRREYVQWCVGRLTFDWSDCYFTTFNLANGYGVVTIPDFVAYEAGQDTEVYQVKPSSPAKGRVFRYLPYLFHTSRTVCHCPKLTFHQKAFLVNTTCQFLTSSFVHWEANARPFSAFIVSRLGNRLFGGIQRRCFGREVRELARCSSRGGAVR